MTPKPQRSADPALSDKAAESIRAHAQRGEVIGFLIAFSAVGDGVPVIDGVHVLEVPDGVDPIGALRQAAAAIELAPGASIVGIFRCSGDGARGFSRQELARLRQAIPGFRFLLLAQPVAGGRAAIQVFTIDAAGACFPSAAFPIAPPLEPIPPRVFLKRLPKPLWIGLILATVLTGAYFVYRTTLTKPQRSAISTAIPATPPTGKPALPQAPAAPQIHAMPGVEAESMVVTPAERTIADYVPPQPVSEVFPDPQYFALPLAKEKLPVEIMLEMYIDVSGGVSHVRLIRAVPAAQKPFAEESIHAAEKWVFRPATASKAAVACNHIIIFRYNGKNRAGKKGRTARAIRPATHLLLKNRQSHRNHLRSLAG